MKKLRKNFIYEQGMVSVEWALTMPLFLLTVLICLSLLFSVVEAQRVENTARIATRAYSLGKTEQELSKLIVENLGNDVTLNVNRAEDMATVKLTRPARGVFRILGIDISAKYKIVVEPVGVSYVK